MTDRCSHRGCREPVEMVYRKKLLCRKHWTAFCKAKDVKMGKTTMSMGFRVVEGGKKQ